MSKISKHITLREAIKSFTAKRRGIENIPSEYELNNMVGIAINVLEPLRVWVGGPKTVKRC